VRAADWPGVRAVPTRYAGNSGARTTGYEETTGDLIAFMDDDIVGDPRWIEEFVRAVAPDDILGCTGFLTPQYQGTTGQWDGRAPRWYPDEFLWVIGGTHRGQPTTEHVIRNVMGGIMMIKRTVFDRVGGFSTALGRGDGGLISCEETEFCLRASAGFPGGKFLLVPTARALHKVPRTRRTWRYFVRRCYAEGISKARLMVLVQQTGALSTEWSYVLRTLTSGVLIGLADPIRRGDLAGPARAAAIVVGLGATVWGYLRAKIEQRVPPQPIPLCAETAD
jgi:glycosyltransferase involved in cell wall biosynthesis